MADILDDTVGGAQDLADNFYTQTMAQADPYAGNLDPGMIQNRVGRKLLEQLDQQGRRSRLPKIVTPGGGSTKPSEAPDFSEMGAPAKETDVPDFASAGAPANEKLSEGPPSTNVPATKPEGANEAVSGAGRIGAEALTGVVAGAAQGTGAIMQGAAAFNDAARGAMAPYYADYQNFDKLTSDQQTAVFQKVNNDPHLPTSAKAYLNQKLGERAQGGAAQSQEDFLGIPKSKDTGLYQAGETLKQSTEPGGALAAGPGFENSWTRSLSQGAGAMIPAVAGGIAAGAVGGPVLAGLVGGAVMGSQAAGDTFEDALRKGADPTQAARAAGLTGLASGAIGSIPVGAIFTPLSRIFAQTPGMMGVAARILANAAKDGFTFATAGEAIEFVARKIESATYGPAYVEKLKTERANAQHDLDDVKANPTHFQNADQARQSIENNIKQIDEEISTNEGYSPDAKRIIANALTGGVVGALFGISRPIRREETPPPPPPPDEETPPGPGTGGGRRDRTRREEETPPGGGERTGRAGAGDEAGPGPQPEPGPEPRPAREAPQGPPATGRASDKLRDVLRYYTEGGKRVYDEAELGAMSMAELKAAVDFENNRQARAQTDKTTQEAGGAKEEPKPQSPQEAYENDVMRRYGFSDDEIAKMNTDQRAAAMKEAREAGVHHPEPEGAQDTATTFAEPESEEGIPEQPQTRTEQPNEDEVAARRAEIGADVLDALMEEGVDTTHMDGEHPLIQHAVEAIESGASLHDAIESAKDATDFHEEPRGGTRESPVDLKSGEDADLAASVASQEHSAAQDNANNIQRGHATWEGRGITIEAPAGGTRKGFNDQGEEYTQQTGVTTGYWKGIKGNDGDHLDVYVGPHLDNKHAFILNETNPDGSFRQHKTFIGFRTAQDAAAAYLSNTGKSPEQIGGLHALSQAQLEHWLDNGDKTQPYEPAAEVHPQHIQAIEDTVRSVGESPDNVPPADVQRAAELHAEGVPPDQALQAAFIESVVGQGLLTPEEIHDVYHGELDGLVTAPQVPEAGEHVPAGETAVSSGGGEAAAAEGAGSGSAATGGEPARGHGENAGPAGGEEATPEGAGGEGTEQAVGYAEVGEPAAAEGEAAAPERERPAGAAGGAGEAAERPAGGGGERVGAAEAGEAAERPGAERPAGELQKPAQAAERPVKQAKAEKPAETPTNLEDVGEKIGGARKDQWAGKGLSDRQIEAMNGAERAKHISKENIWPRPDYSAAVDAGMDPGVAFIFKRIYDRIQTKPPGERQDMYVKAVRAVRDALADVKSFDDLRKAGNAYQEAIGKDDMWEAATALSSKDRAHYNPIQWGHDDIRAAEDAVKQGFPNVEPWQRLYVIREQRPYDYKTNKYGETTWKVARKNGGSLTGPDGLNLYFKTREEAQAAAKAAYEKAKEEKPAGAEEPKRPHLDNVERIGPDRRNGRNIGADDLMKDFGFRGVEFGNWVAGDERQKTVNLAYDALHDLAEVLGLPPKAMSLNGTLALAFGARGHGGKAAAHYEPSRLVINATKLSGAGSLAHEWTHAFDHYLGELNRAAAYQGAPIEASGGRTVPSEGTYGKRDRRGKEYQGRLDNLPERLQDAVNRTMEALYFRRESPAEAVARYDEDLKSANSARESWVRARERDGKRGKNARTLRKDEDAIKWWDQRIEAIKKWQEQARTTPSNRKLLSTDYYEQGKKLSGSSGDYWIRANEMLARANEAYVYDKIAEKDRKSDYLVHGVEPTRFGSGFRGNPYPAGTERAYINKQFDRLYRQIGLYEGKHGAGTRIGGAEGEVEEPVIESVAQPSAEDQATSLTNEQAAHEAAEDQATARSLPDSFAAYLRDGKAFQNIIEARRFAHELGFDGDPKKVEEALELGVVKLGREIVEHGDPSADTFKALVNLYGRQPRLGTRTSTSAREQAYSTPIPLAYVASRLAGINKETTVLEPTAGNGALLIEADPAKATVNELNPDRAKNLTEQGFRVSSRDASEGKLRHVGYPVDVVIANPPFGVVKEGLESKVFDLGHIQPGYRTHEIDHAIALEALKAMKDDGRAVLILGGINKLAETPEARGDAYQGKAKREFYKALYDRYNVTDHFTVNGDLYERQGAGWPVDVVVINGRGKSARPLPAVDVPRILNTWDEVGGLLHGLESQPGSGAQAGRPAGGAAAPVRGLEGGRPGGGEPAGERGVRGQPGPEQPAGVQPGSVPGERQPQPAAGEGGNERPQSVGGGESAGTGAEAAAERRPSGISFDEAFDAALDAEFGPQATEQPKAQPRKSTERVAREAAGHAAEAADKAMEGLVKMFGGGKTFGSGLNFDEETWAKAKPLFEEAAGKFKEFWNDAAELLRRMVAEMRRLYGLTREAFEKMRPYMQRFIDEVRQGIIRLGEKGKPKEEPKPETRTPPREEQETAGQVKYVPQSKIGTLGTLVPVNMRRSVADSLKALEGRVGPIDQFVGKELGLKPDELEKYVKAEQVDALALAIDNMKRNKGAIIGDQTGIGKGRVNALLIRWAMKNDLVPLFVTEKPNLYADMYRDLTDTGIQAYLKNREPKILATDTNLNLPLDEDGNVRINNGDSREHGALLGKLSDPEKLKRAVDAVFTTYNQMQTVQGKETSRRAFFRAIAPNSVILFDESHNAGGQKLTRTAKNAPQNRAQLSRDLIGLAKGVFYSSATYAKNPDVMDLYRATDMPLAVEKIEDLAEAIHRGGVPMQQVVAAMLAEAGQYIRRERSFAGIDYRLHEVNVPHDRYDQIAHSLDQIQDFSEVVKAATRTISAQIRAEGEAAGADAATGAAGAHSTNFTSVMHNAINQILLAMKAAPAAEEAIAALKRGEKPVLTVANTMESFLKQYIDDVGISPGEAIPADFADVLMKYLDRTRTIIIKKPFAKKGETERRYLSDEELGPHGIALYNKAKQHIQHLDLAEFPVSPIDFIRNKLEQAGYKTGEVTGRGTLVDYAGDEPILRTRPGKEITPRGRRDTIKKFNSGDIDALLLNQAGSTGISAHASEKFKDKRPRHMMIVQPEGNVDTHMQLLGRVHRTGQVVLPRYSQMIADVPAEKRPAAVLAKKMASLSANTTGARAGALTSGDVVDFLNDYGDTVAVNFITDNPAMNRRLAFPLRVTETGLDRKDAMRKLTGRIPLLPLKQQEEVYRELESEYKSLIEQMDATGENALEAKTLELKARTKERTEVIGAKEGSLSPFAAPVVMEKVSVARLGKPMTPVELGKGLALELGESADKIQAPEHTQQLLRDLEYRNYRDDAAAKLYDTARVQVADRHQDVGEKYKEFKQNAIEDIEKPEEQEAKRVELDARWNRWSALNAMLPVGKRVTLKTWEGNIPAVALGVERKGRSVNPTALSTWKATFATADASRKLTIPFSRLHVGTAPEEDRSAIELGERGGRPEEILDQFERMQHEAREDRYIATGNLLAAYDWLGHKGKITNYTDAEGHIRQGILTQRGFSLEKHAKGKGKLERDPAVIRSWLESNKGKALQAEGVSIQKKHWGSAYEIVADKSKRTGGVYYQDKALTDITGDFFSRGAAMRTEFNGADGNAEKAIQRLMDLGASFRLPTEGLKTEKVEEPKEQQSIRKVPPPIFDWDTNVPDSMSEFLTPEAQARQTELENGIYDIIVGNLGHAVKKIEMHEGLVIPGAEPTKEWGSRAAEVGTEGSQYGIPGSFSPLEATIRLALWHPEAVKIAHHETEHAMEWLLNTHDEIQLLRRETPRMREALRAAGLISDEEARTVDDREIRAIAYENYASARDQGHSGAGFGLHLGLRHLFDKLMKIFRQIGNFLRSKGFRTAEDIFGKFYEGKMAGREPNVIRETEEGMEIARPAYEQQSVRKTPGTTLYSGIPVPELAVAIKDYWTSNFQPELVSDRALMADAQFARMKSASAQERDAWIRESDQEWRYWNQQHWPMILNFLRAIETGSITTLPGEQMSMAWRWKKLLDDNFALEQRWGSKAAWWEEYFPHVWESPKAWRAFAERKAAQLGPTWFQKARTYATIEEGLAAGLKLRYRNPVDMLMHRLLSGVDMRQRMQLLYKLQDMNLARKGGAQFAPRSWQIINAPDRGQWVLAPDVIPLWKNAVEAKGLWQNEGAIGGIFRGWMSFKNAWVPVKLALSMFHPLHVLHINFANGLALTWNELTKGHDLKMALHAAFAGAVGPFHAMVPSRVAKAIGMPLHLGKKGMEAWATRPENQTPEQRVYIHLLNEMGISAQLSEQLRIKAGRAMMEAWESFRRGEAGGKEAGKLTWHALRRPIEMLQKPLFEHWIPSLKVAAALNEAAALLRRRPELLNDDIARGVALRAIGKSIDNRFGEMFYSGLFWNRTAKDAGIGSFISLGWNLGFAREFGGAALEHVTRPAGLLGDLTGSKALTPTANRKLIRDATSKIPFAYAYVFTAMAIAGAITYWFTGRKPEGMDYVLPRAGGENPDGSPRRFTTMFYTREAPMLAKHIQERNNVLTGTAAMIQNKLIVQPFIELAENRDYWNQEIWDANANPAMQVWQVIKHILGDLTPMSQTGAERAIQTGGGTGDVIMSYLGFGPAPSYASKSATQNRIAYLFREYAAKPGTPYEEGQNTADKQAIRSAVLKAKKEGDDEALQAAYDRAGKIGMKKSTLNHIGKTPSDVYMFGQLPVSQQIAVMKDATPEERGKYFRAGKLDTKRYIWANELQVQYPQ